MDCRRHTHTHTASPSKLWWTWLWTGLLSAAAWRRAVSCYLPSFRRIPLLPTRFL